MTGPVATSAWSAVEPDSSATVATAPHSKRIASVASFCPSSCREPAGASAAWKSGVRPRESFTSKEASAMWQGEKRKP